MELESAFIRENLRPILQNGYDEEARIRDFYGAGDDKIIFRKSLN